MHPLFTQYNKNKKAIHTALAQYKAVGNKDEQTLFAELCFCLCTPQSKAYHCDAAVKALTKQHLLTSDNHTKISTTLVQSGVRFHKNKARYIITARKLFQKKPLQTLLQTTPDDFACREWLVTNVNGLGYKEASHFLRNIGRAHELAILDRHILRNLVRHNAIRTIPKIITRKKYLALEKKLLHFAKKTNIPPAALDLLFWSTETGTIFK